MRYLLQISTNGGYPAHRVIGSALQGKNSSKSIMLAYAVGGRRAEDLYAILENIEDDYIDDETRALGLTAVGAFGKIFTTDYSHRDWGSVLQECLPKENLVSLAFLSPIVSRHHPLPIVRPDEIAALITSLEEALMELSIEGNLPPWASIPLRNGVAELIFLLQNFVFFGHDEAVGRLITLISTASHTIDSVSRVSGGKVGLVSLCTALVLAVDLFASAPNISQAYATYRGWMIDAIEIARPLLSAPPLRIEGPKQPDADGPEDA